MNWYTKKPLHNIKARTYGTVSYTHLYHLNLIPRSVGQMEKGTVVFKAISKKCKEKGFYICGENGVGKIKKNLFALSVGGEQRSAMKSVKDVFDPDGRLNPKNAF